MLERNAMSQISNAAKVLIIENDIQLNRILQSVFSVSNRVTIATYLLEDALKVVERDCLHIIVFDLEIPDGDGWKMLDQLQAALPPQAHPQFILIAPSDLTTDPPLNCEGCHIISRPVNISELIGLVFLLRYEHRP